MFIHCYVVVLYDFFLFTPTDTYFDLTENCNENPQCKFV